MPGHRHTIMAAAVPRNFYVPPPVEEQGDIILSDVPLLTSNYKMGLNWIDKQWHGDTTAVNNAIAIATDCADIINSHMMWFGPYNPWRSPSETAQQMHWANEVGQPDNLDYRMDKLVASGHEISIVMGLTPTFMCVDDGSLDGQDINTNYQENFPTDNHCAINGNTFPELINRFLSHMRTRYGVNKISYMCMWNEFKGLWLVPPTNRWNYEDFTTLYNNCWTVIQNFNDTLGESELKVKVGGPYNPTPTNQGPQPQPNAANELWYTGHTTYVDTRALDAVLYWKTNALGYDFVCLDGSNTHVPEVADWYKKTFPGVPIIWAEFYGSFSTSLTQQQKRIQLAKNLIDLVKNGVVSGFMWNPESRPSTTSFNEQWAWTRTDIAGGGQVLDTARLYRMLKENFGAGTDIYDATLVNPDPNITILASAAKALVVNGTSSQVTLNGVTIPANNYDLVDVSIPEFYKTPTEAKTTALSDTTLRINVPADVVNGDKLILWVGSGYTSAGAIPTLENWAAIGTTATATNGNNAKLRAWTKIASDEPAYYDIDVSAINAHVIAIMFGIPSNPNVNTNANSSSGNVLAHTTAVFETTLPSHIMHGYGIALDTNETVDANTDEFYECDKSAAYPIQIVLATETQLVAGQVPARTITSGSTAYSAQKSIAFET